MTLSPDGQPLAAGDGTGITVWDLATRKPLVPVEPQSWITTVAFSPNGNRLMAGDKFGLRLCDPVTGRTLHRFPAKEPKAVFTRDGRTVIGPWHDPEWVSFRLDYLDANTGRSLGRHREWPRRSALPGRAVRRVEG